MMQSFRKRTLLFALLLQIAASFSAGAQSCSVTSASGNYGSVDILAGGAVDTTSTFTVTCSGCALGCTVNACVQFNQGAPNSSSSVRSLGSGANTAIHELYSDSGRTQVWGSWGYGTTAYGSGGVSINLSLPVLGGPAQQTLTVYGRFLANQQATIPGTYVWSTTSPVVAYAAYLLASPNCSSNPGTTTNAGSSPWTATIAGNCIVSTTPLNFGNASLLTSNVDGVGTISVKCTNTTPYSIGLDNGLHVNGSQRRMQASSSFINYNLYTDAARTSAWTSTTSATTCTSGANTCVLGTGTALNQNVSVYGRVPPQTSPPPGVYADTIIVTVTF